MKVTIFVGAYWSERMEPRETAGNRIASFLETMSALSEDLAQWFPKGKSRAAALRVPLDLGATAIAGSLSPNRLDSDRHPIPDLGFRFGAWNGTNVSLSVTIGAANRFVRNAVVLELDKDARRNESVYRSLIEGIIRAFDPEYAVVTSDAYIANAGAEMPWEAGLFTYERGAGLKQHRLLWEM